LLEDCGFVVFGIAGSVEEGGVAFGYGLFQESYLLGVLL
jgi:hypothetical protein